MNTQYDNTVCQLCNSGDNENVMLLCETCDRGYHIYCLQLPAVPKGDWNCPDCVSGNVPMAVSVPEASQPVQPVQPSNSSFVSTVMPATPSTSAPATPATPATPFMFPAQPTQPVMMPGMPQQTYCLVPNPFGGFSLVPMAQMPQMPPQMPQMQPVSTVAAPEAAGPIPAGTKVFVYERVSSSGQQDPKFGRVGLNTQNHTVLEFAVKHGLFVMQTYTETGSARSLTRLKQLHQAVSQLQAGNVLVVYSVSRFGRNAAEGQALLQQIHNKGASVYAVAEELFGNDPRFQSELMEAQKESDRLSQKMKQSIARQRAVGAYIGSVPYGHVAVRDTAGVRRLQPNAAEQKVLSEIRARLTNGEKARYIAEHLNARNLFNRKYKWTAATVRKHAKLGSTHSALRGGGKRLVADMSNALPTI